MTDILEARDLAKTYESNGATVAALRGVDLGVETGEFVAVMGPSGCGKSTLLHLLGGLDRPTRGEVRLDGERVDRLSEAAWGVLRRRQIGFVFQAFNLLSDLTVADNVELPALVAGLGVGEARERRAQMLADLGLAGKAGAVPAQLSGGEQQRVAIARALVNDPAVLLADEPTGNMDSGTSRELLDLLRRYHGRGQAIVMVTHDPRAASAAGRIVAMRDGRFTDEIRMEPADRTAGTLLNRLIELEV